MARRSQDHVRPFELPILQNYRDYLPHIPRVRLEDSMRPCPLAPHEIDEYDSSDPQIARQALIPRLFLRDRCLGPSKEFACLTSSPAERYRFSLGAIGYKHFIFSTKVLLWRFYFNGNPSKSERELALMPPYSDTTDLKSH